MKILGDPVEVEYNSGTLTVSGRQMKSNIRLFKDLAPVALDKKALEEMGAQKETPAYYMFRNLAETGSKQIQFDITVIPHARIGTEFVKTLGHYHPEAKKGLSFCEVYEVLQGRAHFLLQERKGKSNSTPVSRVLLVRATAGDKIPIPPNFGHVSINPGSEPLILANLVYTDFESNYKDYVSAGGAAYFETIDGSHQKNPFFKSLPPIQVGGLELLPKKITSKKNILSLCRENPGQFDFLIDPAKF
ncbi:Glucose-6-phosphate isomerase [Candidatus Gugararchaeum adminiculabundum]|nr:Glucose-6-phosphate isomerase [Candidatus Gugararchaeum adminiculabundum]